MFFKKSIFVLIFMFINVVGSAAFASGSDDNEDTGGDTFGGGGFGEQRVVDPTYESGKAIYKGRKKTAPKLSYCLRIGNQTLPVKRKSLKYFKAMSFTELSKHLFSCDEPEKSIISQLERKDFIHVLYYLDKRYKLILERA